MNFKLTKRTLFTGALLAVLSVLTIAAMIPRPIASDIECDSGSILQRTVTSDNVESLRVRVCYESGALTYTLWVFGEVVEKRDASAGETSQYIAREISDAFDLAQLELSSDVEVGKSWVSILREWSNDYQTVSDGWENYTTSEKLILMELKFQRDSKVLNGLADLLVTLGY